VHVEIALVVLFSIATAVAIATRRLRIPFTVGLVLAGLLLGLLPIAPRISLTRDLLFTIVLPGIVYEAAVHLREELLSRTWASIAALAIPGVVAAVGLTAFLLFQSAGAVLPGVTCSAPCSSRRRRWPPIPSP